MLPLKEQGCCHGFIVILVVIFITPVILVQAGVMPGLFVPRDSVCARRLMPATQLREQLDRVEAQQRSMTESVVTLKSFALDKGAPAIPISPKRRVPAVNSSIHWSKRSASVLAAAPDGG